MIRYYITILLLQPLAFCYAQGTQAVVTNGGDSPATHHVKLKWYSDDVYYKHGVNIYRREDGNSEWLKLTPTPIKQGSQVPQDHFIADHKLRTLAGITAARSGNELEGLVKLAVLVESVLTEEFALYLGLQFNDSTAELGQTYEYRLSSLTKQGTESVLTTAGPVTAALWQPQSAPDSIVTNTGEAQVGFTWARAPGRFFGFNVYRREGADTLLQRLNQRPVMITTSRGKDGRWSLPRFYFTDDSVQTGKDYYYQITGIDHFGKESRPTAEIHVTTKDMTPPPAPEVFLIKEEEQAFLQWKMSTTPDLAGFNVYRRRLTDSVFTRLNELLLAPGVTSFRVSEAHPGAYLLYVEAADHSGNVAPSTEVMVEVMDIMAPNTPEGLTARVEPGQVTLTWHANSEADLDGYVLYRAMDKGSSPVFYPLFVHPLADTVYRQTFAERNKQRYLYKLVAVDTAFNQSLFSASVSAQLPDVVPPTAPVVKNISVNADGIQVEWLPVVGDSLRAYTLFRRQGDTPYDAIATLAPGVTTYTDKRPESGGSIQYYLTATDLADNSSLPSTKVSVEVPRSSNFSITELKGRYSKKRHDLNLTWQVTQPAVAKGFVVYRAIGNGPYIPVTGMVAAQSFSTEALAAGRAYRYQVRAFDHQGHVYKSEKFEITINE